jgi:hypothetical protein
MPNGVKKKGMPTWLKVIIGLVAFAVIVVIIAMMATSPVVKPVEKQLEYLKAGNVQAAYDLTSNEFKNATTLEAFKAFLVQYPSLSNNKTHKFDSREITNNNGTVKGTLEANDGTQTPIEFRLIKENGAWKILGLQVGS